VHRRALSPASRVRGRWARAFWLVSLLDHLEHRSDRTLPDVGAVFDLVLDGEVCVPPDHDPGRSHFVDEYVLDQLDVDHDFLFPTTREESHREGHRSWPGEGSELEGIEHGVQARSVVQWASIRVYDLWHCAIPH